MGSECNESRGRKMNEKRHRAIHRPAGIDKPQPRAFMPRSCTECTTVRPGDSNYSRVYATIKNELGTTRYVRCFYCGNTWKQVDVFGINSTGMDTK